MKKTLSIVMFVLLVFLAVACSPETKQHEHSYEKVAEKSYAATCKNTGLEVYTCSGCGDTYSVTLPLTGHSHSEKASPVSVDQELYCSQDGIYTYRCNVCGTEYQEVITPEEAKAAGKEVPHAVLKELTLNTSKKKVTVYVPYLYDENFNADGTYTAASYTESTITKNDVNYFEDKLVAATYFTPESYEGYCKSCGEALGYLNKAIETDETISYKEIVGTWVYKDGNGNTYYIDMKTATDAKGRVSCTGQIVDTNEKNKTTIATMGAENSVELENDVDGERTRAIKVTYNSSTYYHISLDSSTGKYVLRSGHSSFAGADVNCLESDNSSLEFEENHNHRYKQSTVNSKSSDSAKAESMHLDENFRVMTHLGQNYILSGNHFLSCSECGMSYVECAHNYIDGVCSSCGYTDDGNGFISLSIGYRLDPDLTDAKTSVTTQAAQMGTAYSNAAAVTKDANDQQRTAAKEALTNAAAALKKASYVLKEAGDSASASAAETAADQAETAAASITSTTGSLTEAARAIGSSSSTGAWGGLTEALEALNALKPANGDPGAAEDEWLLAESSALILSNGKYASFKGETFEFAENTGWNFDADKFVVSGEEYKIVRGPATLTFALKTYIEE